MLSLVFTMIYFHILCLCAAKAWPEPWLICNVTTISTQISRAGSLTFLASVELTFVAC